MPDDRSFLAATYTDLAQADGDYATLRRLYEEFGAPLEFDAVTIGHKASGEARFHSGRQETWSLAAGLAAALLPSVGADAPSSLMAQRAVLCAVAGEVGRALGRRDLMVLGSHVDESPAALLVAAKAEHGSRIRDALHHARSVLVRSADVDLDLIRRTAAAIGAIRP